MSKFLYYLSIMIMCSLQLYSSTLQAPVNLVYDSINSRYLVTQNNNQLVSLDETMQNHVVLKPLNSPAPLYIQGGILFVGDLDNIIAFDLENMQELFRVQVAEDANIKSITGNGDQTLYISNSTSNSIYRLSLIDNSITQLSISITGFEIGGLDYLNDELLYTASSQNSNRIYNYDFSTTHSAIIYSESKYIGLHSVTHDKHHNLYACYFGTGANDGVVRRISPNYTDSLTIKNNLELPTSMIYREDIESLILSINIANKLQTVLVGTPPTPNLIYPANNSIIEENKVTFEWSPVPGVQGYRLWIASDPNFTESLRTFNFETNTSTLIVLDTAKIYYWKVRAYNLDIEGEWSATNTFKSGNMTYYPPTPLIPTFGAVAVPLLPTFVWSKSIAAIYEIQISKNIDFKELVFQAANLLDTTITLTQSLEPNTEYFWRVRAYSSLESIVSWSHPYVFNTFNTPPAAPELFYPTNAIINVSRIPRLEWMPQPSTDSYEVWLANDNTFPVNATKVFNVTADITRTKETVQVIDSLRKNTLYFWKVRGVNSYGIGVWSETWQFITINLGPDNPTSVDELSILPSYPMPASDNLFISLAQNDIQNNLSITLYNSIGVQFPSPNFVPIDNNTKLKVSIGDLPTGNYIALIKIGNELFTVRFIKN